LHAAQTKLSTQNNNPTRARIEEDGEMKGNGVSNMFRSWQAILTHAGTSAVIYPQLSKPRICADYANLKKSPLICIIAFDLSRVCPRESAANLGGVNEPTPFLTVRPLPRM
jgi:hypothetical protein